MRYPVSLPPPFVAAIALVLQLATPGGRLEASEMKPFTVPWPRESASPASVAFLLDAPAGKGGFIRVQGGHLVRPDGGRFRIWGINATAQATVAPKEDAGAIAAHLARLGINCVRFHFIDRAAPAGLIDPSRDDTRALDPVQLDRFDFFVAELKRRGIYSDLDLNVGRTYKAGDGVRDHELLGYAKALTYFNGRLLELQREFARQLLTHRNPYTGAEYRHEPAVALIELVNENSLIEAWWNGRLLGENTRRNPGTWTDIPASYERALAEKYEEWLRRHFPPQELEKFRAEARVGADQPVPRLRREQFAKASKERFQAEASFYLEIERDFFLGMAGFLREEIGVRAPIIGNSDHGHHASGYPIVAGTSLLDVVDGHIYWQHPRHLEDPKTRRRTGFEMANTPMVDDPLHSTVVQLSRTAVAGKPFTVSEANHPFPNEYAAEGVPILAAYAALQDWDGVFWYTLGHRDVMSAEDFIPGHFDLMKDPVKMTQLAAGALMFLRGDVRPAQRTVTRSYTREQVIESIRLPGSERPFFTPGFPLLLPLQSRMRISSLEGPPTGVFGEGAAAGTIASDTGELTWKSGAQKSGVVIVDAVRSQALVGFVGNGMSSTSHLALEVTPRFCAVTLGALDGQPLARSARMLLTATARVANSDMEWNEKRTSLAKWGGAPTLIEPVRGRVTLRQLDRARGVEAQPLDGAGRPLGAAVIGRQGPEGWTLALGDPPTTWWMLTMKR